jgi:hypothetical protein
MILNVLNVLEEKLYVHDEKKISLYENIEE